MSDYLDRLAPVLGEERAAGVVHLVAQLHELSDVRKLTALLARS